MKVRSCNALLRNVKPSHALLRMLSVCIGSYLKSVQRYKFPIFYTYQDTLYLYQQVCGDPWLFFEAKWSPPAKMLGKHCIIKTN